MRRSPSATTLHQNKEAFCKHETVEAHDPHYLLSYIPVWDFVLCSLDGGGVLINSNIPWLNMIDLMKCLKYEYQPSLDEFCTFIRYILLYAYWQRQIEQ